MNWEGDEVLKNKCKDGFPSPEYEKFIMDELNNDKKSLFLIDGVGEHTFSHNEAINLKIMHLL